MRKTDNAKTVHGKGIIEFYINGELLASKKYNSRKYRCELIDRWKKLYPQNNRQEISFIIKPDWSIYNAADTIEEGDTSY